MLAAEGILTARGGVSSHAALVARQMGKVCVCGASELQIDYATNTLHVRGQNFRKGDYLSIDGTSGEIFPGEVKTSPSDVVRVLIDKDLTLRKAPSTASLPSLCSGQINEGPWMYAPTPTNPIK